MVYAVSACLYLSIENRPGSLKYRWLPIVLLVYNILFTFVYYALPTYFSFFVITFIIECLLVVKNSTTMYHHTTDVRLKRMFWAGFGLYIAAFLFLWLPDNLACSSVSFLHLHAWFHITGTIAPWWYINWAIFSFYLADYTCKTGMVLDPQTGKAVPASVERLQHVLGTTTLPTSYHMLNQSKGTETGQTSSSTSTEVNLPSRGLGASGILRNEGLTTTPTVPGTTTSLGDTDPEDTILIIPELRWIGPRSLIMWPYIQLTRKIAFE